MIPKNITREHVIQAIEEIDRNGVPTDREPIKYWLVFQGKKYPPKYTISLANRYANGEELKPSVFSGGDETNPFLKKLGFGIELISDEIPDSIATKYPVHIRKVRVDCSSFLPHILSTKPMTIENIYVQVKDSMSELCDDAIKCTCGSLTRKDPEWKHQVRWALNDLVDKGLLVRKNGIYISSSRITQLDSLNLDNLLEKGISKTHMQVLKKFFLLRGAFLSVGEIRGKKGVSPLPPDEFVDEPHYLHNLVRGFYRLAGDEYALSIQLNPHSEWGMEIDINSPTLRIDYDFGPSEVYKQDKSALAKCFENNVPIGIIFKPEKAINRILGLVR